MCVLARSRPGTSYIYRPRARSARVLDHKRDMESHCMVIFLVAVSLAARAAMPIEVVEKVNEGEDPSSNSSSAPVSNSSSWPVAPDTMQRITLPIAPPSAKDKVKDKVMDKGFSPSPQLPVLFGATDLHGRTNMHQLRSTYQQKQKQQHHKGEEGEEDLPFQSAGDYDYEALKKKPALDSGAKSLSDYDQIVVQHYLKSLKNSQGKEPGDTQSKHRGNYKPIKFDDDFSLSGFGDGGALGGRGGGLSAAGLAGGGEHGGGGLSEGGGGGLGGRGGGGGLGGLVGGGHGVGEFGGDLGGLGGGGHGDGGLGGGLGGLGGGGQGGSLGGGLGGGGQRGNLGGGLRGGGLGGLGGGGHGGGGLGGGIGGLGGGGLGGLGGGGHGGGGLGGGGQGGSLGGGFGGGGLGGLGGGGHGGGGLGGGLGGLGGGGQGGSLGGGFGGGGLGGLGGGGQGGGGLGGGLGDGGFQGLGGGGHGLEGGLGGHGSGSGKYNLPPPTHGHDHPYPYHYSGYDDPVGYRIPSPVFSDPSGTDVTSSSGHEGKEQHGKGGGLSGGSGGGKGGLLKKVLNMLAAFIPLGLFLAAIPPNVLSINSTGTTAPARQRSLDGEPPDPLLALLERYELQSLDDPECESRVFCEMVRQGGQREGNIVQGAFWRLASDAPDKITEALGLKEVFKAIRTDSCSIYRCPERQGAMEELKKEETSAQSQGTHVP